MPDRLSGKAPGMPGRAPGFRTLKSRCLRCISIVVALATIGSLTLSAAPASAAVSHVFKSTFGSATSVTTNPYPLSEPSEVAVDQTSHDVYVTDPGHYRVEKFSPAGAFLFMFGKNVNKTASETSGRSTEANVCPSAAHPGDLCQAGTPSTASGAFENPGILAIDNSGGTSTGDVYVGDLGDHLIQKFDPTGHIITSWGVLGQKDGSDSTEGTFGSLNGLDIGPAGKLYTSNNSNGAVFEYSQDGTFLKRTYNRSGAPNLRVDAEGRFYTIVLQGFTESRVFEDVDNGANERPGEALGPVTSAFPTVGFTFDPADDALYQLTGIEGGESPHGQSIEHYSPDCILPSSDICDPLDGFGSGYLFGAKGLAVDGASGTVYVANSETNDVAEFEDVRPLAETEPPTEQRETSVTLNGHIDLGKGGNINECHFEYGFDKSYGHTVPCEPDPAQAPPTSYFSGPTDVAAHVSGLSPGTHDHYRVIIGNVDGALRGGADETFATPTRPVVNALAADELTSTSADIVGQINPSGLETRYHIDYGSTTEYGQVAPADQVATLPASNAGQQFEVHLSGLVPNVVYHYRLVAENENAEGEGGTTRTEDHTFNFFPPSCPNENVRQQTQTDYLPDCRAYELVSPGDAGGTQLYPGGPNTGYATSPPRLSFTGLFGEIPNSGGSPMDTAGDLYVATRTPTQWVSQYVGLPSNIASVDGGPPQGLPGSANYVKGFYQQADAGLANGNSSAATIQNSVLTDPAMDTFVDWDDGGSEPRGLDPTPIASNAPYVWSVDGSALDRWPTNLGAVPTGTYPSGSEYKRSLSENAPLAISPGGKDALDCPFDSRGNFNSCPGDATASEDLSHFVFSTRWNTFAPGGKLSAPGSVYDNNTVTGTITVASKTPGGADIPSEPTDPAGDPLQIPAVSSDGSHILMASGARSPCGAANCGAAPCSTYFSAISRCPLQPSHLYMRVDDALTYDVSLGHAVDYIGSTPDAGKVYFTSEEQLLPADQDTSTDLYMWSEEKAEKAEPPLTLVSIGTAGEGNSDACKAKFTTKCGVVPYSGQSYCQLTSGLGGNCRSDNSIAAENGDIYFFSPEQLDGSLGIPNMENLYDFREGKVQFVTAFTTTEYCVTVEVSFQSSAACSNTPAVRMEVTPNDSYMAFITASPLTQYDNAGHLEMYRYEPGSGTLLCVSCAPNGAPATSNVGGSQDGLFMTNDGRVFFSTEDGLVHTDTNRALDIYEYVDGRPQLITQGTGETQAPSGNLQNAPGLIGVDANGTDAYFTTYDTLVNADHNGLVIKFYDARTGGGFPAPPNNPPCEAADECHGPGSTGSSSPPAGTEAALAGGNLPKNAQHKKKHGHKHRDKRHGRKAHHKRQSSRSAAAGGSSRR